MNAREILLKTVSENCQWLDMDNLTNTPIRYVLSAMEKFSEQELAALKLQNERLKVDLQKMHDGYDKAVIEVAEQNAELVEILKKVISWDCSEDDIKEAEKIVSKHSPE